MVPCAPRPPRNALSLAGSGRRAVWMEKGGLACGAQLAGDLSGRCRGRRVLGSTWSLPRLRSSCGQAWPRPQSKLGGRQDQGVGCLPGDHTSWAWSSQGCVWGSIRPAGCYQGQMRRWCIRGPDLLRCSVLPDCQGLSGRPDVDTRGCRPSKRGLVGEIKSHPVSGRRRARQGHLGPGTRDDVVGRSTQHFACYILFDVLILLLPLTIVGAVPGF